jgi:hypothetical protein
MIAIEFPAPDFKLVREGGKELIFDAYRKKYVALTPEEWVRQNFLNYLVKSLQYPRALIGIEKEIYLGELKKRCDIVVYNRAMQPWMIVECKEMNVPLSLLTVEQIARYHMVLQAVYLVITNGVHTYCGLHQPDQGKWAFLEALPAYGS